METKYIELQTKGNGDVIDLTRELEDIIEEVEVLDGILFLSVIGSTAAITTMEFESGLVKDLKEVLDRVLPYKQDYAHNSTWSDDNGHSHLRSLFIKTNTFVSVTGGKLDLGTWQQVVLLDFDTRKRDRTIVVKILS